MISDVQRIFHHHHGHLDDHNHPKSNRFSHPHTFRWSILTAFALWRLERNFFFRVSIYTFQGRSFAGGQWIEQEIMCCCRIKVYKSNQNATDCGTATLIDDIFFGFFFFHWDAVSCCGELWNFSLTKHCWGIVKCPFQRLSFPANISIKMWVKTANKHS